MLNPYSTLGIKEDSNLEEIKKAYRTLAIKCHPDKNKDDNASETFNKLNQAYEVLINPEERLKYDNLLKKVAESKTQNLVKGSDLRTSINVKISDLINGHKKVIVTKRKSHCPECAGTGSAVKKIKRCNFCNGTGLQGFALVLGQKRKCKYCNGHGNVPQGDKCTRCHGATLITESIRSEIKLNPFSETLTIPDLGNFPVGKGKAGDLIVELSIEQDPRFKVRGLNVSGYIGISPAQAILGDEIPLNVFDKEIALKIPPGTKHNDVIDQEYSGITYEGRTGYFRATINLVIPEIITEEEKDLYKKLLATEKRSPTWPTILSF